MFLWICLMFTRSVEESQEDDVPLLECQRNGNGPKTSWTKPWLPTGLLQAWPFETRQVDKISKKWLYFWAAFLLNFRLPCFRVCMALSIQKRKGHANCIFTSPFSLRKRRSKMALKVRCVHWNAHISFLGYAGTMECSGWGVWSRRLQRFPGFLRGFPLFFASSLPRLAHCRQLENTL